MVRGWWGWLAGQRRSQFDEFGLEPNILTLTIWVGKRQEVSAAGDATFTANLTSTAAPQGNLAIMNLSSSAVVTNVIDTNTLSGCTRISNVASDGTIFAVWALSPSNHLLLLENTGSLRLATPQTKTLFAGIPVRAATSWRV
jgi:hypothetical protein